MNPGEPKLRKGLPLRALPANAITILALCFGLTGVRFAIDGNWSNALASVVLAGVLDGFDGRIARLLKAQSRFGAELDSLSDVIAFGVAPAMIMFHWSLTTAPRFGWIAALAIVVCQALRLARYNAQIDVADQPRKDAGFNTGVPAPAGAGLSFVPLLLWQVTGNDMFREWTLVMPWVIFVSLMLISSVATFSWSSLRVRPSSRIFLLAGVGLLGAALVTNPWLTLLIICLGYLALIPFSMASYAKVRRRRAAAR